MRAPGPASDDAPRTDLQRHGVPVDAPVDVPVDVPVDTLRYAPWWRRVLAVLLDVGIVSAVVFLVGRPGDVPTILPGLDLSTSADDLGARSGWWGIGTLAALVVMQAYTGWTPGKRVAGIAVVDATTLRPIRLGRTVLRWLAHLFDTILLIGYLRPLWDPRRRTFADGLLGSVVLETRSPDGDPTATAPFARAITPVAGALCAAGALLSVGSSTAVSESVTLACVADDPVLGSLTLTVHESVVRETRLGITRERPATTRAEAVWTSEASGLGNDVWYRAALLEDSTASTNGTELMACEG